ncbi:hypothetical protein [Saccharopolyspora shandongensis]|uniref:hypothetical protein n=1 Tax=Saccharopolyspora shandongensis TaxID=418495 RepID=UPI0033E24452
MQHDRQRSDVTAALGGLTPVDDARAADFERARQLIVELLAVCSQRGALAASEHEAAVIAE